MTEGFRAYVEHGWKICRIKAGDKGPKYSKWNSPGHEIPVGQAEYLAGAGLMHAYSSTCALDIDSLDLTRAFFAKHGIDLDALINAPDSVAIDSGRQNRWKLLYALPEPLYTCQHVDEHKTMVFELRCKSRTERTTQDVLPPTIHPKTGKPYAWRYGDELLGDWRNLPPLPESLRALWLHMLGPASQPAKEPATTATAQPVAPTRDLSAARAIIAQTSPECDYDTWKNLGMALEHDLGQDGYELWREWSSKYSAYVGDEALAAKWDSFGQNKHITPITLGSFKQKLIASKDMFDVLPDDVVEDDGDPFEHAHKEKVSALTFIHASEIVQRPPTVWLVDDLLPREDLTMMFGESGAGKSFLALDLSLAISRGTAWHGMPTRKGPVCWIAAEAEGSMRGRLRAYAQTHLPDLRFDDVPFFVLGAGVNLADNAQMDMLAQAAKERSPVLCVVDTLAAASAGADENSFESIGVILETCRHIHRTTGATVLLVHHSGKDASKGARGHSSLKAAMHAELCVSRTEEGARELRITKLRDGIDGKRWEFTLSDVVIGHDERDKPIVSACVTKMEAAERVKVQGDGNGRRPPSDSLQRTVLAMARDLIGTGRNVEHTELIGAVVAGITPPMSGERDTRQQKVRNAIDALCHGEYLVQCAGLIGLFDADPDQPQEGCDLV